MFFSYWVLKAALVGILLPSGSQMEASKSKNNFEEIALDRSTFKYKYRANYNKFLEGLKNKDQTLDDFVDILKECPFPAYFFETPKVTLKTLTKDFEFILARADDLNNVRSDVHAFQEHFTSCKRWGNRCLKRVCLFIFSSVSSFPNLGKDALMVVPCPDVDVDTNSFSSLGPFMRDASSEQTQAFWATVGREALKHIRSRRENPTYMSTSGLGVYWLHLRL